MIVTHFEQGQSQDSKECKRYIHCDYKQCNPETCRPHTDLPWMTWNLGQYSRTSSAPIGITQGETETETAILLQIFLRRLQVAIVPSSNMSAEPNTCLCLDRQRIYPHVTESLFL